MLKNRGFVLPFLFLVIAAAALSVAACGPAGNPAAVSPGLSDRPAPAGGAAPGGPSAAPAAASAEVAQPPVPAQAAPAKAAPAMGASLTAPAPAAAAPLPFASAEERTRFEAALSAGTALAGPDAAENAEAWARGVEAAGALDDTIARLENEAAKKAAPPQVAFALAALYGRKGLERQEYAALARAEECAKDRPELAFNLAAVYGRKETLKAQGKVEELVTGSIRALSEPAGARVFLDGKDRGTTPLLVEGLKAGDHELRFELEGYDAQVAKFALGAGEPASFSAALKANQGELVIRYQLASAADAGLVHAWLDGKDLGLSKYATHTVLRLPFGSHAIRVEAPGYTPAERTVVTSLREEAVVIKLAKN